MKKAKSNQKWMLPLMMFMLISISGAKLIAQPATPPPPPEPTPPGLRFVDQIPDLKQEQKDKIITLHTTLLKEILPLENQILEKEAHLRTLTTAEKTDMKAINKTIDEISALRGNIQKKRMKFLMDSRSLLTEDQRVIFDRIRLRGMNKGNRAGYGYGRGPGKGQGVGRGNRHGRGNRNCR